MGEQMTDIRKPAYFTVQDMRHSAARAAYHVRGYDVQGNLLLHTWHTSEHSMKIEVMAWESRGAIRRPFSSEEVG